MLMYIDPGTGSMLFAILIGIIGAVSYLLKMWIVKLKFLLSGGKAEEASKDVIPIAFFSDDKRYWSVFEPVCKELDKRNVEVVYLTSSEDDPALNNPYENIKAEYIGSGNKAFSKLNFIKATILVSTTPGLDVLQWKRSKDVKCYIHMLHGANEVAGYRMFGVDYYDAVMLSGEYQVEDLRYLEKLRSLPEKDVELVGVPYMDKMVERLKNDTPVGAHERTVLLAPSWGPSSILNKYGERFIDLLIKTGYHIIIRPHPQSFTAEKELMEKLMAKYPETEKLEWNRDNDNYEVLKRSDILISDFSGVVFDFCLVYDKPVIYADTEFDTSPYDFWWLEDIPWTFRALPRIGEKLTADNLDNIKGLIDGCIENPSYAEARAEVRDETWVHRGEGAARAADYIIKKYEEYSGRRKENDSLECYQYSVDRSTEASV